MATVREFEAPQRSSHPFTDRGPARVSVVYPGGPAQRAGIRPGDVLTQIDGKAIDTLEGAEQLQRLSSGGESNPAKLKLTFRRVGCERPLEFAVQPTTFDVESVFGVRRRTDNSWDYMLDRQDRIGYVRLGFINNGRSGDESSGSSYEMSEALLGLKAQGLRGLIFDLRGNPGGFVTPAKEISGMFIKSGTIAHFNDRMDGKQSYTIDNGTGILKGIPTIVLIDGETARRRGNDRCSIARPPSRENRWAA